MTSTSSEDETPVGLRAHATSPDRTVFVEPENRDGWIATDFTVTIEP